MFGINTTSTPMRCSMAWMSARFSFNKKVATSTGNCTWMIALLSFMASSCVMRNMCKAVDSMPRMWPVPLHRGQGMWLVSPKLGRKRWRDSSSKPKREILPVCTRARSWCKASRSAFSTSRWLRWLSMSIKSMTTKPPRSRKRNWRATSSAASILVLKAVCSISLPRVARPEFTSTETRASVWSITIAPPEGKRTSREKADSIWCSIWKRVNRGISSWYNFTRPTLPGMTWLMNCRACSCMSGVSINISPISALK